MSNRKKVLIFVHNMYEELELHYPRYRLIEAGCDVVVAGEKKEKYAGKHGYPCQADEELSKINAAQFDALVIPGGYAPDKLRMLPDVLKITKEMHGQGKVIAFICHAGWVPVSAGILKGTRCTSYKAIKDDMVNAGAQWVDEKVVVHQNLISSRCPDDLPAFCAAIIDCLKLDAAKIQ